MSFLILRKHRTPIPATPTNTNTRALGTAVPTGTKLYSLSPSEILLTQRLGTPFTRDGMCIYSFDADGEYGEVDTENDSIEQQSLQAPFHQQHIGIYLYIYLYELYVCANPHQ